MEIIIKVDEKGQLTVGGPIENKILCLGILELAKQSIINYQPKAIQVAPASILAKA